MENTIIDVNFDFTNDTPKFWDHYWDDEIGKSAYDPDLDSKKLKEYHKILWSKQLPNGEFMNLNYGKKNEYLTWKTFKFGSDSITASFRYERYRYMIMKVISQLDDYKSFFENYIRSSYTIGGEIIFPKKIGSINQLRGCNTYIKDRFDLTLECIRKYYNDEYSPLYKVLLDNKSFFDLFVNFKNYVDYFYLQDLVNDDYTKVKFWIGNGDFQPNPLPRDVDEYFVWIKNQLEFVNKRNKRIDKAVNKFKK